jgi:hypothetical protein
MKFINDNIAIIENTDLIDNVLILPDIADFSITVNQLLVSPDIQYQNNKVYVKFYNISQSDVIHIFFHKYIKGITGNKGFSLTELNAVNINNAIKSNINLVAKSYQPRLQDFSQKVELDNQSSIDTTITHLYSNNYISFKDNITYESFISANSIPTFKVIVNTVYEPIQIQYYFYDERENIIEKITTLFDHLIVNENSSSSSSSSLSSSSESSSSSASSSLAIKQTKWTSTLEISKLFHSVLKEKGITTDNIGNKTYHNLYWRCRYSLNLDNGMNVMWRNWSPLIMFQVNQIPTKPTGLKIT